MMRTSLVLPLVALAFAGITPVHAATPNALNIAPEKPLFVAAMTGLEALERRLENSADRLGELGFEDPGIDTLRAELLRELGIKKKTFFDALGLASDGAVAVYITEPDDDAVVIALDVGNQKQFEAILTQMLEESSTSFSR